MIDARVRVTAGARRAGGDTVFDEILSGEVSIAENSINFRGYLIAYASFKRMAGEIAALSGAVTIEAGILNRVADVAV